MPLFDSFSNAASRGDGVNLVPATAPVVPLYNFPVSSTLTLTPGGQTGPTGPSLATSIAGLSSNQSLSWTSNTAYFNQANYNGYVLWTVPATGNYQIQAIGATGGGSTNYGQYRGQAANMTGTFALVNSQKLIIVVGQYGADNAYDCGGGGASWVMSGTGTSSFQPLIIAGGAGGNSAGVTDSIINASTTTATPSNGYSSSFSDSLGGRNVSTNGNPGGGGGMTGAGAGSWFGNGFTTGLTNPSYQSYGGFGGGGGGGGTNGAGGGGGYTGGNSTPWSSQGGGGSSYNVGTNQSNTLGTFGRGLQGSVIITRLS